MYKVDDVIRARLTSEVPLIDQVAGHIIHAGGKRMRPALVLLFARSLGYQENLQYVMAAVVEFIHTATLLHDDVVDESTVRRGLPTANAAFGNAASVLVGDFLYSRAFQMMLEADSLEVMCVLANATNTIAEGEVLQLLNISDPDITEDRYFQVIHYKTARLFEAAAQLGVLICGADQGVKAAAALYGRHIGTAFQLIDDVLDYSGNSQEIGKNLGDDLREGKATLPLIRALQVGQQNDRRVIEQAILSGGSEQFDRVLGIIQTTDALDYTRKRAQQEADKAREALATWPASIYRETLIDICHYALTRAS